MDYRQKTGVRVTLSLSDKIDIVEKVKFKWIPHKRVAREYRVSESVISKLMTKVRENKGYIKTLARL